jgi:hypothetical protein
MLAIRSRSAPTPTRGGSSSSVKQRSYTTWDLVRGAQTAILGASTALSCPNALLSRVLGAVLACWQQSGSPDAELDPTRLGRGARYPGRPPGKGW